MLVIVFIMYLFMYLLNLISIIFKKSNDLKKMFEQLKTDIKKYLETISNLRAIYYTIVMSQWCTMFLFSLVFLDMHTLVLILQYPGISFFDWWVIESSTCNFGTSSMRSWGAVLWGVELHVLEHLEDFRDCDIWRSAEWLQTPGMMYDVLSNRRTWCSAFSSRTSQKPITSETSLSMESHTLNSKSSPKYQEWNHQKQLETRISI